MTTEVLRAFTRVIRPLFGIAGTCRYTVTCSAYARYTLKNFPLYWALWLIFKRILSCNLFILS
ncbi:MAG: membrane protein insertion efficiency factor YidD [Candidatus Babeliaceae bacterium]|nr:membrane protein insertion efficiency factor YidD [Candidatus Babeliaceae bacterium]